MLQQAKPSAWKAVLTAGFEHLILAGLRIFVRRFGVQTGVMLPATVGEVRIVQKLKLQCDSRPGHYTPDRHAGLAQGVSAVGIFVVPVCLGLVREFHFRLPRRCGPKR